MKHLISARWLTNRNCAPSHLLHNSQSSYEYLLHCQKWRLLCSLSGHIGPPIMLAIEPRMISNFEHVIQSLLNICFFCLFLHSQLTTYYANLSLQIIAVLDLGTSTLFIPNLCFGCAGSMYYTRNARCHEDLIFSPLTGWFDHSVCHWSVV